MRTKYTTEQRETITYTARQLLQDLAKVKAKPSLSEVARMVGVPVGTLGGWMHRRIPLVESAEEWTWRDEARLWEIDPSYYD